MHELGPTSCAPVRLKVFYGGKTLVERKLSNQGNNHCWQNGKLLAKYIGRSVA